MKRSLGWIALLVATLVGACSSGPPATDLRTLVVQDSTYYDPETMMGFTGPIYRTFPGDSTKNEIEGALLDGTWDGELVVYHPSGRIRYLGSFDRGHRCGPWTENQHDREQATDSRQLMSDIESLSIYPPCPADR